MMKSIPIYLFPLWLLLCLSACQDKAGSVHVLNRAEALLQEYPDSSLHVLKTLSLSDFRQESNQARFALLYSQALDKNYIDETDDSLISVAVDYYKDKGEVRDKFLSYYYMGRVHANGERYLQATSCLMKSEQLADEVGDDYLSGLLYSEMGRIYQLYYDYPKSLEAYGKAAECYERAGKVRHRNYMWRCQSNICRNVNDYDESERLLQMVLKSSKEEQDSVLIRAVMGDMIMQYIEQEKMIKADSLYKKLQCIINLEYGSPSYLASVAQMYLSFENLVQAEKLIEEGWVRADSQSDSISMYLATAELYRSQGRREAAYQELQKGMIIQNKEAYQALQQPVLTAQRDYLSEKLEFEAYRLQTEKLHRFLVVSFLVLLLLVVAGVLCWKLKKRKSVIVELEKEKRDTEKENERINFLLKQLDEDKREADRTIKKLKDEIVIREESSSREIADLMQDLEQGKGSVEELKRQLAQNEDSRLKMKDLVRKLETDNEANAESVSCLRTELEILQKEYRKKTLQKVELLKNDLEHMMEIIFLHEEKWPKAELKEKQIENRIRLLKQVYLAENGTFGEIEKMVNTYLENAMLYFREEVSLASEADYRRVCYMFAGVSAPFIAQIMGESKEVVYQRRSRLVKKIASSSLCHKELFMMLLSK